ncbi:MAG: hypothetical protein MZW92_08560 [Comamonadaceae bacterium]|nr:hypothetical protein [Comamonadaceae bacterium]
MSEAFAAGIDEGLRSRELPRRRQPRHARSARRAGSRCTITAVAARSRRPAVPAEADAGRRSRSTRQGNATPALLKKLASLGRGTGQIRSAPSTDRSAAVEQRRQGRTRCS